MAREHTTATTADIAHQFGKPDSDGCHYMRLAKLVVGKNHLGAEHLSKPWDGYDSATKFNGEDTYRVIFDTDCILPYALIRYAIHKQHLGCKNTALQSLNVSISLSF